MGVEQAVRLDHHYTRAYRNTSINHDSPETSRVQMIRRIVDVLLNDMPNNRVLNVGSGPQMLERQLMRGFGVSGKLIRERTGLTTREFLEKFQYTTMDIATLPYNRLLARQYERVSHVQADALSLPFANNAFGLVVSNVAIDFIPRDDYDQPYRETYRVTAPGGTNLYNFHHPEMIPGDIMSRDGSKSGVIAHWQYLVRNGVLFESEQQIEDCLGRVGFSDIEASVQTEGNEIWWQVSARKL